MHEHSDPSHTAALPMAVLLLVWISEWWDLLVELSEVGRFAPNFPGQVVAVVLKMSYFDIQSYLGQLLGYVANAFLWKCLILIFK